LALVAGTVARSIRSPPQYIYDRDQLLSIPRSTEKPATDDTDNRQRNEIRRSPPLTRERELEAEPRHVRERGKLALKQRDEWERRALAAEERARFADARAATGSPCGPDRES
jgi:hypothetical protein